VSMDLAERVDDPLFDPDLQKVTESLDHREAVDVIALSAILALDAELRCVRDLNWYPTADMSVHLAPDIMVVPRAVLAERAKSYRQIELGGPPPSVVLEVPSHSNTVSEFAAKLRRVNAYGVVAYVVDVAEGAQAVLRYEASSVAPIDWADRRIPELGGITIDFVDGALEVTGPNGISASTFDDIARLYAAIAATEAARAEAEAHRADELAAKLRALGHDPEG